MRVYAGGNAILDRLAPREREILLPGLSVFAETEARVLYACDQPLDAVYFPIDAVYSVVEEVTPEELYEIEVIGCAGAAGAEFAIGARTAHHTVLCRTPGLVARLPASEALHALELSWTFYMALHQALP